MDKAKHSLIRIERIDGQTVSTGLTGDDPDELLAMLGDGLALWLFDNPTKWRTARRLMRCVLRDWRPDWISYLLSGWPFTLVGAFAMIGAIYALSYVAHWLGVV